MSQRFNKAYIYSRNYSNTLKKISGIQIKLKKNWYLKVYLTTFIKFFSTIVNLNASKDDIQLQNGAIIYIEGISLVFRKQSGI